MRNRIISAASLVVASIFLIPLAAQAIFYAPGQTLNPACGPTDPNCGVTTPFTLFQNGNVGIGTANPAAKLDITGTNTTAVIGPEMIVATADKDFSSDTGKWTGTNWSIAGGVDTHTTGANALTLDNTALTSPLVAGNLYQLTFTVTTTVAGTLTPNLSGIISGTSVGTNTQIQVVGAGTLTFTPNSTWTGSIDNVSIKQITPSSATQIIRNADGTIALEIRSGGDPFLFSNTFVGFDSGEVNTTGFENTAIGTLALANNTTGQLNTATGFAALIHNTTGTGNTANGAGAMNRNTTGGNNTAIGTNTMLLNTTGLTNTAIGSGALFSNTTGSSNTAIGNQALFNNTSGGTNIVIGALTANANTTGSSNTAVGGGAFGLNTTGGLNVAIGGAALQFNVSATSSTAIGFRAGAGSSAYSNQGGVYAGFDSGRNATTGSDFNTLLGYQSGFSVSSGARNVLIGVSGIAASIGQITTGSSNISIGNDVAIASSTLSNQLDIGNLIYGTGLSGTGLTISPGSIGIGTTTPGAKLDVNGTIRQQGCITAGTLSANTAGDIICTPSSLRFKDNIQSVGDGLSEIVQLRPVSFNYRPELDLGAGTHFGLIAEEVASVTPEFATYDAKGAPYGLDTNAILAAAVNAIKELDLKVNGGVPTAIAQSVSNVSQSANSLVSSSFDFIISQFNTALGVVWENGLLKVANVITDKLTAKEICAGNTCISEEQLQELLAKNQITTNQPASVLTPPAPPSAPESVTTISTTTGSTTMPPLTPEASSTPLLPNTGSTRILFLRTLDIGSSGPDVVALQTALMQKGLLYLPPGMAPGYFGELTREAVMKYQSSVDLPPTGVVGPATRASLNR